MSATMQPTSFPQFPNGDAVITLPAAVDGSGTYLYPKSDIGWCLRHDNTTRTSQGKTVTKHCLGALRCMNEECKLYGVDIRPKTMRDSRSKQETDGCKRCKNFLVHIRCSYVARFAYEGHVCRLEPGKKPEQNRHTHGRYMAIHLSSDQEQELGNCIEANPGATPKDLILGMSSAIGTTFPSVRNINPMLQNIDRLGYHVRKEKRKKSVTEKNESGVDVRTAIQELYQVQEDFSDMFVSFDLTKGSTLIGFRPPAIASVINLQAHPMIMDATFTVFQKGFYLCTTVIYCQEIQKYAIIFSAVIDGLSQQNFKTYFLKLFDVYGISFYGRQDILGIIMDFSDTQRAGFIQAYHEITGRNDGIKYIKGCRVHFKRNVFKMAEAYRQHNGGEKTKKEITKLATSLTLAKSEDEYNTILNNLEEKFEIAKSWIKWWDRNDVRSTIFPAVSAMKPELQEHPTIDTNAVESFHNEVYRRMKKRSTSLVTNLKKTLQLIQHDDFAMDNYLQGSSYYYGKHEKKSKKKKKRKHVGDCDRHVSRKRRAKAAKYVNDGDAPCTIDTMERANKRLDADAKRNARDSKKKKHTKKKSKKEKKRSRESNSQ